MNGSILPEKYSLRLGVFACDLLLSDSTVKQGLRRLPSHKIIRVHPCDPWLKIFLTVLGVFRNLWDHF